MQPKKQPTHYKLKSGKGGNPEKMEVLESMYAKPSIQISTATRMGAKTDKHGYSKVGGKFTDPLKAAMDKASRVFGSFLGRK
jgi:hypothetical protein